MNYRIKVGCRLPKESAQAIGEELERLSSESGSLSAADVVEAATEKKSPLNPFFEWDDVRAAQLYREEQARSMLRSIVVTVTAPDKSSAEVRAFYSVIVNREDDTAEHGPGCRYVSVGSVRADPELAEQVIQEAYESLESWLARFENYRKVFPPFETKFKPVLDFIETSKSAIMD